MHVRCPHCDNAIELLDETDLSDVSCNSCGSQFSMVAEFAPTIPRDSKVETIGHFELVRRLGMGAIGEVWKATDRKLQRSVAIKFPRNKGLDYEDTEFFFREARAAAQLKHPNIVSVHEVGRHEDRIFIVSDYIDGITLADQLTKETPDLRDAAELTVTIAKALHYAHEQGVIHRDLKPSNIMLDDAEVPHVMDFGLAKREAGEITMTVEGQLLGTPAYMSPEQAQGSGHRADRRSDVYSLGVILFELVTGRRPFLGNASVLLQQVVKQDPPEPRSLNERLPVELNTIILKCLEKDPDKRYPSAQELADELGRWLRNEPIRARPAGVVTRARKWAQRHPTAATLLSVIVVSVAGLFGLGLWYQGKLALALSETQRANRQIEDEKQRALDAERRAVALAGERNNLYKGEQQARAEAEQNLQMVQQVKRRLLKVLLDNGLASLGESEFDEGLHLLATAFREIADDAEDLSAASLLNLALWQERMLSIVASVDHATEMRALQFSADGSLLLTAGLDHRARIWDSETGEPAGRTLEHPHQVESATLTRDGSRVLTGCFDGSVRLFNSQTGNVIFEPIETGSLVRQVLLTSDEKTGAARSNDGKLTVFDCRSGETIELDIPDAWKFSAIAMHPEQPLLVALRFPDHALTAWDLEQREPRFEPVPLAEGGRDLRFSPSGSKLCVISSSNVNVFSTRDPRNEPRAIGHRGVSAASFSSNDQFLATATYGGEVATWNLSDEARLVAPPLRFAGQTNLVEFVPGTMLLAVSAKRSVRLWNPLTQRPVSQQQRSAYAVAFSSDGRFMATGSADSPVRIWGVESRVEEDRYLPHEHLILAAAFDAPGERVITAGQDESVKIWNTQTGEQIGRTLKMPDVVSALAVHPDGSRFAVGSWDGTVRLYDTADARLIGQEMQHQEKINRVSFSVDGTLLFSGADDGLVKVWDSTSGEPQGLPLSHETVVQDLAIDSERGMLVAAIYGGKAIVWDLANRKRRGELAHLERSHIANVEISPDGSRILTVDNQGLAKLWDAGSLKLLAERQWHRKGIAAAAFSHDGSRIVSGSYDQTSRVWDGTGLEPLSPPLQHASAVLSIAFSPDDTLVVTGSDDDTAQLWHAATGIRVGPAIRHLGKITVVKFNPNGREVLTAHGTARLTRLPVLQIPPDFVDDWVEAVTGIAMDEDGVLQVLSTREWLADRERLDSVAGPKTARRLPLARLLPDTSQETGPFGQMSRSFRPRPVRSE